MDSTGVFESPFWKRYKEFAAVRGFLQWIGVSGGMMAIIASIGSWLWAQYAALSGPLRFITALAVFVAVSIVFAFVRYLVGSDPPAAPVTSEIFDSFGKVYEIEPRRPTGKRRKARIIASVVIIILFGAAFYTGALDKLAASIRPDTAVFMECDISSLPISVPAGGKA
jgi:hypothetical protein